MVNKFSDKEWNYINQISLKIHASEDVNQMRSEFFSLLQNLVVFDWGSFYLYGHEFSKSPVGYNLTKEDLKQYTEKWENLDPFKPLRNLLCDYNHTAIRVNEYAFVGNIEDTQYYKLVWKPKGIKYSIFAGLGYNGMVTGSISLYRREGTEDFADRDIEIVNLLKNHINIRLWREVTAGKSDKITGLTLLDIKKTYRLTDRELEVIDLWSRGLTDNEICDSISISKNTLKKHISNIYGKLNINSRVELLKKIPKT